MGKFDIPHPSLGRRRHEEYMDNTFRQHIGMTNNYKMYARWVKGAIL